MPLSEIQSRVLDLLAINRSEESHLAGASGIQMSPTAPRTSHDLDLFHDSEKAVANAFNNDHRLLLENDFLVDVQLSQPGFIRARIQNPSGSVLIDWARDSIWRFFKPVPLEGIGYVLHPVDLAVNKVLALAGRDEPRDFLDTLYLHETVLPIGALIWAAAGKDPGMNPRMLLELLQRKGLVQKEELERLDLRTKIDLDTIHADWKLALAEAKEWITSRPAQDAGCLYADRETGRLIAPEKNQPADILRGQPGGVLPMIQGAPVNSFIESEALRSSIESFFHRKIVE